MKKYFFMALLASLLIMPSCKKESKSDPTPVADNPIVKALEYSKPFFGEDTAKVFSQLVNDGWNLTSKNSRYIHFGKLTDNNIFHDFLMPYNDSTVNKIWVEMYDENEDADLLGATAFKECMVYVGQSITFAGITAHFKYLTYFDENDDKVTITDFNEALASVDELYNGDYFAVIWENEESSADFSLMQDYKKDKGEYYVQVMYYRD